MIEDYEIICPGRIVSFDAGTQLARVQPSIEALFNGIDFSYQPVKKALLLDVPVQFPQGGGYDITFPIKEGDDCLILFSQRGYDHWLYSDKQEAGVINEAPAPEHRRIFSAQDALALVGFRPVPKAIKQFSTDGMDIRNEARDQRISLKDGGNIEVDTTADVVVNAGGSVTATAGSTATVTAPTITLNGNVTVNGTLAIAGGNAATFSGTITSDGEGTFNGVAVSTHTHTGDSGGNTSPPN